MKSRKAQNRLWRVSPNPLRHASEWWDYARASHDAPEIVRPLLDQMPAVEVRASDAEIAAIRQWAANLPEWEMPGRLPQCALLIEWQGEPLAPETARRRTGC